jgi:hypothetical protein
MADKVKSNETAPVYITTVIAAVLAAWCGAWAIGAGIAMFAGYTLDTPGVIGWATGFGGGWPMPIAFGLAAILFGVGALLGFKKTQKLVAADASFIQTNAYQVTNNVAIHGTGAIGTLYVIYALAVAIGSLLIIQKGLPWASYYLAAFLPALLIGGALIGVSFMLRAFTQAKLNAQILATVLICIAGVGLILSAIAIGVKSHSSDAGTMFGIERKTTIKTDTDYSDYWSDYYND